MKPINLILLGESGVGKTTILNWFKTGQYVEPDNATVSVEFHAKKIHVEDKEITIFLWDTSGQERYNAVVRSYYRNGEGVLLVYDVTKPATFYKLSKWLMELKEANENPEILIAGNKNEDPTAKSVNTSMVRNFARDEKLEYMEMSALNGDNVDKAFDYLIRRVLIAKGILPKDPESPSPAEVPKNKNAPKEKDDEIITLGQVQDYVKPQKKSSCC